MLYGGSLLLTHSMETHYCDCIIEGSLAANTCYGGSLLLTHAMETHYCDCIIEGGLLTNANGGSLL